MKVTPSPRVGVLAAFLLWNAGGPARGAFSFTDHGGGSFSAGASGLGQVIPDNNPSGVAYALQFTQTGWRITDLTVTFTITGGWNGDLYAYLSHLGGVAVLLNRVGRGRGQSPWLQHGGV